MEGAISVLGCQPRAELHGSTHGQAHVGQACCTHAQCADTDPFGKSGSDYASALLSVCFAYQGNPALYIDINMGYHIGDFPAQDYVIQPPKFFLSYCTAFYLLSLILCFS